MVEKLFLRGGRLITPLRVIERGGLLIEGGQINALGEGLEPPRDVKILNLQGNYIAPGFIDIHVHGGGGADVMDGTVEALETISRVHAAGGTTSLLATTLTAPLEEIRKALESIACARRTLLSGAQVLGAHLEGPYFSMEQRGAQNPAYLKNPKPQEYLKLLEDYPGEILRVSAAPELEGALELGRALRDRGILASIGHSSATYDEILAAIEAGYTHVTHLYSGMSGVKRVAGYRVSGVIEATLLLDELTTEVIADGHHLPPSLLRLILKAKGLERVSLVTDAIAATGMPPGNYTLGELEIIVEDGVAKLPDRSAFAGSVATMNLLVRNMVQNVGLALPEAVKMATLNPARLLKLEGRKGLLAPGADADIVVFDNEINILLTIVGGRIVFRNEALLEGGL
jgi:N-acetylglucosamine-6-phosphate deacetylase